MQSLDFRRPILVRVVILSICIGSVVLVLVDEGFRGAVDDTAALSAWAVAFGTLALAAATFRVALRAKEEAQAVRDETAQVAEQIRIQKDQLKASQRAYVYPWSPHDWAMGSDWWAGRKSDMLPVKNGGPGLALNVQGRVVWNLAPGSWKRIELYASSIAPNDSVNARASSQAINGWAGALGYVRYSDLAGDDWVTFFRIDRTEGGHLVVHHHPTEQIESGSDPHTLDNASLAARTRD